MNKVLLFLAALVVAGGVHAQSYPNRPVKVVVPWPPGQATDLAARIVAEKLSQQLGQQFVIENKPGAGGAIGTEQVVKSAPDGYTLLAASSGPISIMPNLQATPYDPLTDLAPVSLTNAVPFALVVHPSFPASNAKEFIALVRANPGKYTFSSSGTGATAHLFAELFNSMAQLKALHVPYKGTAPAMTDLIGGQISYAVETVAATVGHIKSGRLKAFGVTSSQRTAALPDLAPLAEAAGLPGYDCVAWGGYAAPRGTPREILERLAVEIQKAVQAADLKERFVTLGMDTASSSPEQMGAFMRREQDRYATIIRNANIKIEK
jgi:tripartite-type tricarboxylate transporter receptor subunit TctC